MARKFNFQRTATVVDLDPNTSAPADADILDLAARREANSGNFAQGVTWYLDFTAGASPTADVTVWAKDEGSGIWASVAPDLLVANRLLFETLGLGSPNIFIQLTNFVGAPTDVTVYAEPAAP